jgi:hypothetical protein
MLAELSMNNVYRINSSLSENNTIQHKAIMFFTVHLTTLLVARIIQRQILGSLMKNDELDNNKNRGDT